jgi:hypothetical protein
MRLHPSGVLNFTWRNCFKSSRFYQSKTARILYCPCVIVGLEWESDCEMKAGHKGSRHLGLFGRGLSAYAASSSWSNKSLEFHIHRAPGLMAGLCMGSANIQTNHQEMWRLFSSPTPPETAICS